MQVFTCTGIIFLNYVQYRVVAQTSSNPVHLSNIFSFFSLLQNEEISINTISDSSSSSNSPTHNMELSFEYLMSKNCLQWITIASEHAILMSVCLQSMVDELLNQKDGNDLNNIQVNFCRKWVLSYKKCKFEINVISLLQIHNSNQPLLSYIRRDGKLRRISESSSNDTISSLVNVVTFLLFI